MGYEYKCVPAPSRPKKRSRKARSPSDRIALAMEQMIQEHATDGWEYMRADLVQVLEKPGLLSRAQEIHRTVLVFRREDEETRNRHTRRRDDFLDEELDDAPIRRSGGLRRGDRGRAALTARDDDRPGGGAADDELRLSDEDRIDPGRRTGPARRPPPSGLG